MARKYRNTNLYDNDLNTLTDEPYTSDPYPDDPYQSDPYPADPSADDPYAEDPYTDSAYTQPAEPMHDESYSSDGSYDPYAETASAYEDDPMYDEDDPADPDGGSGKRKKKKSVGRIIWIVIRTFLIFILIAGVCGGIVGFGYIRSAIAKAPDLASVTIAPREAATYIYTSEGKRSLKLTLPESNRDLVVLKDIPVDLQHAFVAIEDSRFYKHSGIDFQGIARAFVRGITRGSFSEGASTITQQLLKNTVFTGWTEEKTFKDRLDRKIQEQYLALQLEKIISKDHILEDYLNIINLGAGCYGVQAASYKYFGKDVSELTLSECTVIAGITKNPTRYNPITYPEYNASRREQVLDAMLKQKYITQSEYDEAMADNVYDRIHSNDMAASQESTSSIYSYYEDALIDQVINDLQTEKGYTYQQAYKAVYTGGLRIFTAQDPEVQQICDEEFERASNFPAGTEVGIDYALSVQSPDGEIINYGNNSLRKWMRENGYTAFDLMFDTADAAKRAAASFRDATVREGDTVLGERVTVTPQPQASVVIIDQKTGYVKAVVGGRGKKDASLTLNRATYTTRQPGSTFKILAAYAPLINEGRATIDTLMQNVPSTYSNGVAVSNWDLNDYTGPTSIRDAIIRSINVIAVQAIQEVTPEVAFEYCERFGISTLERSYSNGTDTLSDVVEPLALGGITMGVTGLDLAGAYACIANSGNYIAPKFYTQVLDQYGEVVLDNTSPASKSVITTDTAAQLTAAMEEVITDKDGTAHGYIDLGQMPVAGKTGTTNDYRDIWFAGFTPYYTCAVWGGYDNNTVLPNRDIYHTYNKTLWNSIMNRLNTGKAITSFGIKGVEKYEKSGEQETQTTPAPHTNENNQSGSALPEDTITIFSEDQYTLPNAQDDAQNTEETNAPSGTDPSGQEQDNSPEDWNAQDWNAQDWNAQDWNADDQMEDAPDDA